MSRTTSRTGATTAKPWAGQAGPGAADSAGQCEALLALVIIAAATVLVYSNTFGASFHLDDDGNIVRNPTVHDLRNLWPPSGTRWLGFLSFALNYQLGGLDVFGYHLANLLIHLSNGLLVFWLAAITLRTPAMRCADAGPLVRRFLPLTAGLLFAVHPVATQAVTYIVQRFTSLATLFFLTSLVSYAMARVSLEAGRPSKARAAWLYGISLVAAAAAMKTKEISFTLPVVLAGYEMLFFRSARRLRLLAFPATIALLVPLALAPNLVHELAVGDIPRSVYLITQPRVIVTYLRLLLVPFGQNLDYDFPLSRSLTDPGVISALGVMLTVTAGAAFLLHRSLKTNRAPGVLIFFGIAWFFVTLSVESSIIPISDVIFEHRVYLPSIGAVLALASALLWVVERLRLRLSLRIQCAAALLLTAGPLGATAYARNSVWRDELTLWRDVVRKSPGKARPHNHLGIALLNAGAASDALTEFQAAVRIQPSYAIAWSNLGNAYHAEGRNGEALRAYREAVRLMPELREAHGNLAIVHEAMGQFDDAVREYREAIRLAPGQADGYFDLGNAYYTMGRLDDAARELGEAIRLDPSFAPAHSNLGGVYLAKGRLDDAESELREAIRIEPRLAEAHKNLAATLARKHSATAPGDGR